MEAMTERILEPAYAYQYTMAYGHSCLLCHAGVVPSDSSRGIRLIIFS